MHPTNQIWIPRDVTGGGSDPESFDTYDKLHDALTASGVPDGTRADLVTDVGFVATFERVSASAIRVVSQEVYLNHAYSSTGLTFTSIDGNLPTWDAPNTDPSAGGGIILDGSGGVIMDSLGYLQGHSRMVSSLCYPTLTSEADGQAICIGCISEGEDRGQTHGIVRDSGNWYGGRALRSAGWFVGTPGAAGLLRSPATGREQLTGHHVVIADGNSDAEIIGGGYAGESGSDRQDVLISNPHGRGGEDDHVVTLYVEDAGGSLSVRVTRLVVASLVRDNQETP